MTHTPLPTTAWFALTLTSLGFTLGAPSPATAQEGLTRFEDVEVETLSPQDIAGGLTVESPNKVIRKPKTLPEPPEDTQLRATRTQLASHVLQIVSVRTPPPPYEQKPTVTTGHAVWVQGEGDDASPHLITTGDWLQGAEAIYLIPSDANAITIAPGTQNARAAQFRNIDEVVADRVAERLEKDRAQWTDVSLTHYDKWRNLAELTLPDEVAPPKTGLRLFDTETEPLPYIYGYSPMAPEQLTPANILPTKAEDESLQFYFQTSYTAILGAPLVSPDGRLIVLNALRHPKHPERSLAVPPGAIAQFLTARDDS